MEKKNKSDEIDLFELLTILWRKRYFIIKVASFFLLVGLLVAFTSKVEYKASCKLLPETQEGIKNNLGGLGGLAGLAGINLDLGGNNSLTPDLYPEIVKSIPFQLDLIQEPIQFDKLDTTLSSYEYFSNIYSPSITQLISDYTLGLPGKIKSYFRVSEKEVAEVDGEIIRLNEEYWKIIEMYKKRLSVSVDLETGIISISSEMPDAYAAAKTVDVLVNKLKQRVTQYKIEKVQLNLNFIEERFAEKKKDYEEKQQAVAAYSDRNINVVSFLAQTELRRLENELEVAFEVYKGLASQLEQARIKVKEETPVFTILEPVQVPLEKSKPKRLIILLISVVFGVIIASTFILAKNAYRSINLKNKGF